MSSELLLSIIAGQLTRCIDMFWCPTELLTLGKKLAQMDGQAELTLRATQTAKEQRQLALLDKLNELDSSVVLRLIEGGLYAGPLLCDAKKQLRTGQSNGKLEDMRKVKIAIGSWRNWEPPLLGPDDKVNQGMQHLECAYLLSDQLVKWDNQELRTQFVSYSKPPMQAKAWGQFLWPYGQYNAERPSEGLLRSELMVKTAKAFLFLPATSKDAHIGAASGAHGHQRRGPIGIAKTYDIAEVTPSFLAYVAVVLRHALTSDETFGDCCGGFNYMHFYEDIRDYLERPRFKSRAAVLMDWWNCQLFSEYGLGLTAVSLDHQASVTMAALEAEMEAEDEAHDEAPEGASQN